MATELCKLSRSQISGPSDVERLVFPVKGYGYLISMMWPTILHSEVELAPRGLHRGGYANVSALTPLLCLMCQVDLSPLEFDLVLANLL